MPRPSDPHARARLLEAAAKVFAEKGLDRAKVEDITGRAALSKGAFYLHFESKEQAFSELVTGTVEGLTTFIDECQTGIERSVTQGGEGFLKRWLECEAALFDFIWKNRAIMRLLLDGGKCAEYQHLIEHFAMRAQRNLERGIRAGIEAGMYRSDLNVVLNAAFIAGGYDRFARQLVRQVKKPDIMPMLAELQQMVLKLIGSEALLETFAASRGEGGSAASPASNSARAPEAKPRRVSREYPRGRRDALKLRVTKSKDREASHADHDT